ncbi:MAG: hypothetical protein U1F43_16995 [Myxococcota bacterium]
MWSRRAIALAWLVAPVTSSAALRAEPVPDVVYVPLAPPAPPPRMPLAPGAPPASAPTSPPAPPPGNVHYEPIIAPLSPAPFTPAVPIAPTPPAPAPEPEPTCPLPAQSTAATPPPAPVPAPADPAPPDPALLLAVAPAAPGAPAASPRGPFLTLRRPTDCKPHRSSLPMRAVVECAGEERARVALGAAAPALEPLPAEAVRARILPIELKSVWRTCPFAVDAALEARPDLFVAYEDRDVGRCYLWAPLDRAALAKAPKYDRAKYLDTIHPYMKAVILRAIAESAAAGQLFHVISGTRPGGKPSWHTFGLAVDVNIAGRKGLKEATNAFLAGGAEHDAWIAFAESAERLGLYWLGRNDPDEIFHFEWRPGWSGLPHGEVADGLSADFARGGLEAVWQRLAYDPTRPTAQAALRDPPAAER